MVVVEVETCDGVSSAKKRFLGVDKQGNKWRARAKNPLLRADVHLGYYKTPEEAAEVAAKKRAEFEEMFKGMDSSSMGNCRGYFQGKKLPKGVRWKKGRYLAQVWHPKLKKQVFCGSFKNCEEAANAADKKRAELQEKYGVKLWVIPDNEVLKESEGEVKSGCSDEQSSDAKEPMVTNESPMKFECEFGYDLPTSLSCAHNLNALDENSNYDCKVVDIPGKIRDGLVYWSPTSVFDPKNMNTASVDDKTFDSEFDIAVSLGIINEYGQLLGKYSEIDAQIWLTNV